MNNENNKYNFNRILLGLILFSIGNFFYENHREICYVFTTISIISIITSIDSKIYYMPFKGVMKIIYIIFLIFIIINISRGLFSGMDKHSMNPIYTYGILAYFTPFIILIGTKNIRIDLIVKYSIISAVIGFISFIINFKGIFGKSMFLVSGDEYQEYLAFIFPSLTLLFNTFFAFLIYYILNKKQKYILFLSIVLLLFTVIFAGRRGSVLIVLITIIFALYLFLFKYNKNVKTKILKWVFTIFSIIIILLFFYIQSSTLFAFLNERGLEDSRSWVEEDFFKSFSGNFFDLFFGRGISGTYETFMFDKKVINRGIIETGYLNIILKGGVISLTLFLIIMINSFIKGFFKSKNIILKAMSLYILIHILYLYPFGIPSFSLEYLFLWCSVAYCQSPYWRSLNDIQILRKTELL